MNFHTEWQMASREQEEEEEEEEEEGPILDTISCLFSPQYCDFPSQKGSAAARARSPMPGGGERGPWYSDQIKG